MPLDWTVGGSLRPSAFHSRLILPRIEDGGALAGLVGPTTSDRNSFHERSDEDHSTQYHSMHVPAACAPRAKKRARNAEVTCRSVRRARGDAESCAKTIEKERNSKVCPAAGGLGWVACAFQRRTSPDGPSGKETHRELVTHCHEESIEDEDVLVDLGNGGRNLGAVEAAAKLDQVALL